MITDEPVNHTTLGVRSRGERTLSATVLSSRICDGAAGQLHRAIRPDGFVNSGGARIRHMRSTHYSQLTAAVSGRREMPLDRIYLRGIERGKRNVALRNIEATAEALEVTISELLKGV